MRTSAAQNAEVQNIDQQQQYRHQANDQVKNLTQQINTNSPQQLASKEESQFVNTLRNAQAGTAAGGASNGNSNTFGQPVSALPQNVAGASTMLPAIGERRTERGCSSMQEHRSRSDERHRLSRAPAAERRSRDADPGY